MKLRKIQNGGQGGHHIGNSDPVTKKFILNQCENRISLLPYLTCITSFVCLKYVPN